MTIDKKQAEIVDVKLKNMLLEFVMATINCFFFLNMQAFKFGELVFRTND